MEDEVIIKCKCTKCNQLFDYHTDNNDPTIHRDRNEDGLLECLCSKCAKKIFRFGAWEP